MALAAACSPGPDPDARAEALEEAEELAVAIVEERAEHADDLLDELPKLSDRIRRQLRTHLNRVQVATARRLGVRPVRDSAQVAALVEAGRLVPLGDTTDYWIVRPLTHSVPYVTPATRAMLVEVGQRFHARLDSLGLPRFRFEISSALRTRAMQASLRRGNSNASRSTSSHEFGTTVDVAYLSFAAPASLHHATLLPDSVPVASDTLRSHAMTRLDTIGVRHAPHIEGELGAVLQAMQRDGSVLTLRERGQPVFHITVARPVADPG